MFFPSRTDGQGRRFFRTKVVAFVVGTVLVILGIRFDNRWLLNGGIVVLAIAFLLRFVRPRSEPADPDAES
jgi:hypothetical protein